VSRMMCLSVQCGKTIGITVLVGKVRVILTEKNNVYPDFGKMKKEEKEKPFSFHEGE